MENQGDFRIGDWHVQPRLNRVTSGGTDHHLEPKVMEVLLCLANQPGAVVSRDELLSRAWPDTVVVETTVFRAVSELRRVFGDDPKHPRVIETVRKRGYRLILPVMPTTSVAPVVPTVEGPPPPRSFRRMALPAALVLGFVTVVAFQFRALNVTPAPAPDLLWPSPPMRVTSSPELEVCPTLSPDGRDIAYIRADGDQWKTWVQRQGETSARMLNLDGPCEKTPAFSPDGQHIALWRETEKADELAIVPVLGGPARVLTRVPRGVGGRIAWSADGKQLSSSWKTTHQEPRSIYMIDSQVKAGRAEPEIRRLTTPPDDWFGDINPTLSPSGKSVAFVRSSVAGHVQDIYLVPVAGGEPRRLTFDRKPLRGVTWKGDDTLLFSSKRSHQYALWLLSIPTGEITWTGIVHARNPTFASRENVIAYEHMEIEVNIWEGNLRTGEMRQEPLIQTTQTDVTPHLRPDGKAVALSSDRTGHYEIWTCRRDGMDCRQLTHFRQFASRPRWSPDGRRIAFQADLGGNLDLFVIDTPGETPRRLISNVASDEAPSWSADGRWIYFASERGGVWEVWKVASGGGEPVPVTRSGGFAARESPDGRWLYYTRAVRQGLWRMPTDGGVEELVIDRFPYRTSPGWEVLSQGVVFALLREGSAELVGFDPKTRTAVRLFRFPMRRVVDLTISPDLQTVLFTRVDRKSSDIFKVRLPG